jgi:hypothetical protein
MAGPPVYTPEAPTGMADRYKFFSTEAPLMRGAVTSSLKRIGNDTITHTLTDAEGNYVTFRFSADAGFALVERLQMMLNQMRN